MAKRVKKKRKTVKVSHEILEHIGQLSLMNNAFMNLALEGNLACVEEILRVILGKLDLIVKTAQTQRMLQGFKRSIYLDVYAEESKGTRYNIEIQQSNEGADLRRARFHMGMIDVHSLKAGQDFKELPECYVIFITEEDVLKRGKSVYTIHKYIDGELDLVDDGSHMIYINGSAEDDGTEIWKLIHDFRRLYTKLCFDGTNSLQLLRKIVSIHRKLYRLDFVVRKRKRCTCRDYQSE